MNNYDYPLGADTPDAPWNQTDNLPLEFEVFVSQSLSRNHFVKTTDYKEGEPYEDVDHDSDGNWYSSWCQGAPDCTDTDWPAAYKAEHKTPLELIAELKRVKELHIKMLSETTPDSPDYDLVQRQIREDQCWIQECENWVEDELIVMKD